MPGVCSWLGKCVSTIGGMPGEEIDGIDQPFAPKPCPLKVSLYIIRKKDTGKTRGWKWGTVLVNPIVCYGLNMSLFNVGSLESGNESMTMSWKKLRRVPSRTIFQILFWRTSGIPDCTLNKGRRQVVRGCAWCTFRAFLPNTEIFISS